MTVRFAAKPQSLLLGVLVPWWFKRLSRQGAKEDPAASPRKQNSVSSVPPMIFRGELAVVARGHPLVPYSFTQWYLPLAISSRLCGPIGIEVT